jgi:hypothetical protein
VTKPILYYAWRGYLLLLFPRFADVFVTIAANLSSHEIFALQVIFAQPEVGVSVTCDDLYRVMLTLKIWRLNSASLRQQRLQRPRATNGRPYCAGINFVFLKGYDKSPDKRIRMPARPLRLHNRGNLYSAGIYGESLSCFNILSNSKLIEVCLEHEWTGVARRSLSLDILEYGYVIYIWPQQYV